MERAKGGGGAKREEGRGRSEKRRGGREMEIKRVEGSRDVSSYVYAQLTES